MSHRKLCRSCIGSLCLLAGLLCCSLAAIGQEFDNVPQYYFNERTFEIPFEVRTGRFKQVVLHVSTDGKVFTAAASAGPSEKHFVYPARTEGWHYFVVQAVDFYDQKVPAKVTGTVVNLSVCVDLTKPTARLRAVRPRDGHAVAVEWKIEDNERVDLNRTRIEYRATNAAKGVEWAELKVERKAFAQYGWSPPPGEYEVRLTAFDVAGNTEQTIAKVTSIGPVEPKENMPGDVKVYHVPSKTFQLDYDIDGQGQSGVKTVEVWYTKRDTKMWTKYVKDAPVSKQGSVEIKVPAAGRYGFTLRPISGVGRAVKPPEVNKPPQVWVEVDEKAPDVSKVEAEMHEVGPDRGKVRVSWSANDRWLRKTPITVKYSQAKEGPWVVLKGDLPNTGTATLELPQGMVQFYVRVEAIDEAGNVGHGDVNELVHGDLNEPIAKINGVKGSPTAPAAPATPTPAPMPPQPGGQ